MGRKPHGHYCRICGERKANEKFSGSGHAAHICKACAAKSPAQKSEDVTLNRLQGMAFRYLNESEINWLKNRRNDSRPEVRALAQNIFEEKFPRQARNEIKAQLHIEELVFRVCGEVFDGCGDEYFANAEYAADMTGQMIRKSYDENGALFEEKSASVGVKQVRKFFNAAVHNYDVPFWDTDLCHEISRDPEIDLLPEYRCDNGFDEDEETEQIKADDADAQDDRKPTWHVEVKYVNGDGQDTKGFDFIPDPVNALLLDFEDYFEEDFSDDAEIDEAEN